MKIILFLNSVLVLKQFFLSTADIQIRKNDGNANAQCHCVSGEVVESVRKARKLSFFSHSGAMREVCILK